MSGTRDKIPQVYSSHSLLGVEIFVLLGLSRACIKVLLTSQTDRNCRVPFRRDYTVPVQWSATWLWQYEALDGTAMARFWGARERERESHASTNAAATTLLWEWRRTHSDPAPADTLFPPPPAGTINAVFSARHFMQFKALFLALRTNAGHLSSAR